MNKCESTHSLLIFTEESEVRLLIVVVVILIIKDKGFYGLDEQRQPFCDT